MFCIQSLCVGSRRLLVGGPSDVLLLVDVGLGRVIHTFDMFEFVYQISTVPCSTGNACWVALLMKTRVQLLRLEEEEEEEEEIKKEESMVLS